MMGAQSAGLPPLGGPGSAPPGATNMNEMMGQMMGGAGLGGGAPGQGGAAPASMESLLQAGQQLAQQMQQSNPELVEQLRRQMGGGQGPFPPPDGNPPPQ